MKALPRLLICVLLSLSPAFAVPDGAWNGKPWDKQKLETAVQARDPEALAEMAYWTRYGLYDVKYDLTAAFKLAEESAKAGNPYGMALVARGYTVGEGVRKNEDKGLGFARRSAEAGHPLGKKDLANLLLATSAGKEDDSRAWRQSMQESAAEGCLLAGTNVIKSHAYGLNGSKIDLAKGISLAVAAMEAGVPDFSPAAVLLTRGDEVLKQHAVEKETVSLAVARLEMGARCGEPECLSILGSWLCQNGDPERGLPMLLRAVEMNYPVAKEHLFGILSQEFHREKAGLGTDYSSIRRLARQRYAEGDRRHDLFRHLVQSYLFIEPGFEEKPDPAKAMSYLDEMKAQPQKTCGCYHYNYGIALFSEVSGKHLDRERGLAHYIAGGASYPWSLTVLAHQLAKEKGAGRDPAAAFATGQWAVKNNVSEYPVRMLDKIRAELTPEQQAQADDLIRRGYPAADEFIQQSIDVLIRHGDLPPGSTVEDVKQYRHE